MPDTATRINIVDDLPNGTEGLDLWKNGHITKCEISRLYTCDQGRLVVPKASNSGASPLICKMHEAVWWMEIIYDLERIGSTPIVPSWELDDTNLVLLSHKFEPFSPVPYDDALFKHHAKGHYKFVMLEAPVVGTTDNNGDFMTCHAIYWTRGKAHYRMSNFSKAYVEWQ